MTRDIMIILVTNYWERYLHTCMRLLLLVMLVGAGKLMDSLFMQVLGFVVWVVLMFALFYRDPPKALTPEAAVAHLMAIIDSRADVPVRKVRRIHSPPEKEDAKDSS